MGYILFMVGFLVSFVTVSYLLSIVKKKFVAYKKEKEIQFKNMVHEREVTYVFNTLYKGISFSECYTLLENTHFIGLPIDKWNRCNLRTYIWNTNDADLKQYTFVLTFMHFKLLDKKLECNNM